MDKILASIVRELEFEQKQEDFGTVMSNPCELKHFYDALFSLQQLVFLRGLNKTCQNGKS